MRFSLSVNGVSFEITSHPPMTDHYSSLSAFDSYETHGTLAVVASDTDPSFKEYAEVLAITGLTMTVIAMTGSVIWLKTGAHKIRKGQEAEVNELVSRVCDAATAPWDVLSLFCTHPDTVTEYLTDLQEGIMDELPDWNEAVEQFHEDALKSTKLWQINLDTQYKILEEFRQKTKKMSGILSSYDNERQRLEAVLEHQGSHSERLWVAAS